MKHLLLCLLAPFGVRNRLRCPSCESVGTWKPHGGMFAFGDKRKVVRWLCKYCGYYRGPEGERQAYPSTSGAWEIPETQPEGCVFVDTPKNILIAAYVHQNLKGGVWPWRG